MIKYLFAIFSCLAVVGCTADIPEVEASNGVKYKGNARYIFDQVWRGTITATYTDGNTETITANSASSDDESITLQGKDNAGNTITLTGTECE